VSKTSGQIGNILTGQTTNNYTPSGDSIGTNYYQVLIQNTFCQTSLQTGAYTVNRPPSILTQPNTSNFINCLNFGGLNDITVNARDVNNGFNLQYQLFKTRIQNNQNGILFSQISTATPLDDSVGTFYYFAKKYGFEAYDQKEKAIIAQAVRAKKGARNKESAENLLTNFAGIELEDKDKELLNKAFDESEKFENIVDKEEKSGKLDIAAVENFIKANWDIRRNQI
jgi:hypothetical protein